MARKDKSTGEKFSKKTKKEEKKAYNVYNQKHIRIIEALILTKKAKVNNIK